MGLPLQQYASATVNVPSSTLSVTGSDPTATNDAAQDDADHQETLQAQRLQAYMAEPWHEGNRLAALPYHMRSVDVQYPSAAPGQAFHHIGPGIYPNIGPNYGGTQAAYYNAGPAQHELHEQQSQDVFMAGSWAQDSYSVPQLVHVDYTDGYNFYVATDTAASPGQYTQPVHQQYANVSTGQAHQSGSRQASRRTHRQHATGSHSQRSQRRIPSGTGSSR